MREQRDAERCVGALEGLGRRRRSDDQLGAHADVLRALAGEDEGDGARACGLGRFGGL